MTTVDCPWCAGDAQVVDEHVICDHCAVIAELAADGELVAGREMERTAA